MIGIVGDGVHQERALGTLQGVLLLLLLLLLVALTRPAASSIASVASPWTEGESEKWTEIGWGFAFNGVFCFVGF